MSQPVKRTGFGRAARSERSGTCEDCKEVQRPEVGGMEVGKGDTHLLAIFEKRFQDTTMLGHNPRSPAAY